MLLHKVATLSYFFVPKFSASNFVYENIKYNASTLKNYEKMRKC